MLIFSLWQPKWTKGYLDGKKAGQSDSIFKTYHLILEPALEPSKGSHYTFCAGRFLAPADYTTIYELWALLTKMLFMACELALPFGVKQLARGPVIDCYASRLRLSTD